MDKPSFTVSLRKPRRFFIFGLIFLMALTGKQLFAQSILKLYGQVIGTNGPVIGARIELSHTGFIAVTDNNGYFRFFNTTSGQYKLTCRLGDLSTKFIDQIDIGDGPPIRRDIYLADGVLNFAPVYVEATRESDIPGAVKAKIYQVKDNGSDISELIRTVPGLNLIASTAGNEIYISANGSRPEGLNILIDGRKINSLLTGKADLSQLPIKAVKQIEYYGPGTGGNSGGLSGMVNFVTTTKPNTELINASITRGSFGKEIYETGFAHMTNRFGYLQATFEKGFLRNNYRYTDYFDQTQTRNNAQVNYDKYSLSYARLFGSYYMRLSGFLYDGSNGVPGKTIQPSPLAQSQKRTLSTGINVSRRANNKFEIGIDYSYMARDNSYIDYLGETRYVTKYIESENIFNLRGNIALISGLKLYGQSGLTYDMLNGLDNLRPQYALGRVQRHSYSFDGGANYNHDFHCIQLASAFSGKAEFVDSHGYNSYSSTLSFGHGIQPSFGTILAYSNTYRLPGLAELNWKEDIFVIANPQLKPERARSKSIEFYVEYKFDGQWRTSIEYQDTRYKNLIFWRRSQGLKYKPINISASDYFGTIITFSYKSPSEIMTIEFSRTISVSLNRESNQPFYGKYLIFQPHYINSLNCRFAHWGFNAGINMQDVGQRYYLEENTKSLHPYTLFGFKLGYEYKFRHFAIGGEYRIENLTNAHFDLLEYQPMPPRAQSLSLNVKI